MARLSRLTLPGVPHHILQRGNNRQPIFSGPADYQLMLTLLEAHARAQAVAVHGYVLMPNHFHLLATPETATGVASMMQAVGRAYVRRYNQAQGRSGTLWEGRYRSTLIDAGTYLVPCLVYMDLNPVRAELVAEAADYPWSSYAHFAGHATQRLITPPAQYWALGNTPFAREAAYAERVRAGLSVAQVQALSDAVSSGWPLGAAEFLDDLQGRTGRRVARGQPGRPPRVSSVPK